MLRQLKIAARTSACFALMVVLVFGLGIFSIQQLHGIREQSLEIENDALPGLRWVTILPWRSRKPAPPWPKCLPRMILRR
ncbi:hypothetical protein [Pseudomonas savastanoi]|uniref:hypothetical protein n=1 Tax=Pseudomonas savastanoi TaxID=29438 RepID=UPI0026D5AFB7